MKSIIIIFALFLVTLTTKADWVKSGELDSLYLGDAPITFSKYSPDYTKFVTYSAQDSTLRLWDLGTGKVIKERTFEKAYSFSACEFDFESENFVMHYWKSLPNKIYVNYISYLNFKNNIIELEMNRSEFDEYNRSSSSSNYIGMRIYNSKLTIYYSHSYRATPNGTQTEKTTGSQIIFQFRNDSLIYVSPYYNPVSRLYQFQGGTFATTRYYYHLYGTNDGPVNQEEERNGINIDFNSLVFNQENVKKTNNNLYSSSNALSDNYPYLTSITPIDIAFKHFVFNDNIGKIKFFSGEQNKLVNLNIGFTSNEIRKFMLIESPQFSLFYKEKDTLNVYNNRNQNILSKYYLPEGFIAYDKSKRIIYSATQGKIYKCTQIQKLNSFIDIWTNKKQYLVGDSVKIYFTIPSNVSDVSIYIDGIKYSAQTLLTIKTNNIGFINAKILYTENGIKKTYLRDSLYQVKDSLKISFKVTNLFNNNTKYPFYFEAFSNDPETVFTWGYSWCMMTYRTDKYGGKIPSDNIYTDNYKNGNQVEMYIPHEVNIKTLPFTLKAENGVQSIKQKIDFVVNPNLAIKFNKYKGMAPFTFKAVFEKTLLLHPGLMLNYYCIMNTLKKQLIVGDSIKIEKDGGAIDTITQTIIKPGIYKIILRYSNGYEVVHDSVITVYDPTDIQDFAERKYIFKQDAEGIYCQLEGEGEVSLYDNVGRLVRTYQIENERYIRKEDLERGVYFLSIQTNGNVYHEKVLVE